METSAYNYSSPRASAMVMALVSALVLSPLYMDHRKSESRLETRWSCGGLMVPAVVVGLIVAIKTTNSSAKNGVHRRGLHAYFDNNDGGSVSRIGIGSSCGLAGILLMLKLVISWQAYVKHFFWR